MNPDRGATDETGIEEGLALADRGVKDEGGVEGGLALKKQNYKKPMITKF